MTVRANKAIRLELDLAVERGRSRWFSEDPIRLPGRRRVSSRPAAPASAVRERVEAAAEKGRVLVVGDEPINGHHTAEELAGAWVAAHKLLHEVDPAEAVPEWTAIVSAARRTLAEYFKGDFEEAITMIRWSMGRAFEARVKRRLTWRSVFHAGNVTDFKVARASR